MFPNEVTKELLVDASLVDNLDNGESVLVDCHNHIGNALVGRGRHTAVSQKVQPSSTALSKTGSASSRLRLDPSPKLMPMAPKPGDGTVVSWKGSDFGMSN